MSDWLAVAGRVAVRSPTAADQDEYLARVRASAVLHRGWVSHACTPAAFAELLKRGENESHRVYLLVRREDGALVGTANLTQIDDGPPGRAWIAFKAFVPHDGQGYMTDGVGAVLSHAFGSLRLQRVEADVEPSNVRSLALLARVGFQRERYLPRHVEIGGRWRDRERWAILADQPRTRLSAAATAHDGQDVAPHRCVRRRHT